MRPGLASVLGTGIVALGLLGATVFVLTTHTSTTTQPTAAAPAVPPQPTAAARTVALTATPMPAPAPGVVATVDGRTLFQRKGCIACHSVSAAGLQSLAGFAPELSALPQVAPLRRPGMSADAYVRESIRSPQAFRVPGFTDIDMPALPVSDAELDTLVAFLLK
jgi:mono/diheme cytochrome c family protein